MPAPKGRLLSIYNHLLVSFLFIFQNDNDLIDNDNAGQSPAAQAVVLTFSLLLIYYLLLVHCSVFFWLFAFKFSSHSFVLCWVRTAKVSPDLVIDLRSSVIGEIISYFSRGRERIFCSKRFTVFVKK